MFHPYDAYEKKGKSCAVLRFLVNLCADLLPFARTRLTAQTACSVAAANTGLPTEASQGTMICLFLYASESGYQPNRNPPAISESQSVVSRGTTSSVVPCMSFPDKNYILFILLNTNIFFVFGTDFLQGLYLCGNEFVFMDDEVDIPGHADTFQRKDHHIPVIYFFCHHSFGKQCNSSAADYSVFDSVGTGAAEDSV